LFVSKSLGVFLELACCIFCCCIVGLRFAGVGRVVPGYCFGSLMPLGVLVVFGVFYWCILLALGLCCAAALMFLLYICCPPLYFLYSGWLIKFLPFQKKNS
jgi:hypothetical protein